MPKTLQDEVNRVDLNSVAQLKLLNPSLPHFYSASDNEFVVTGLHGCKELGVCLVVFEEYFRECSDAVTYFEALRETYPDANFNCL